MRYCHPPRFTLITDCGILSRLFTFFRITDYLILSKTKLLFFVHFVNYAVASSSYANISLCPDKTYSNHIKIFGGIIVNLITGRNGRAIWEVGPALRNNAVWKEVARRLGNRSTRSSVVRNKIDIVIIISKFKKYCFSDVYRQTIIEAGTESKNNLLYYFIFC